MWSSTTLVLKRQTIRMRRMASPSILRFLLLSVTVLSFLTCVVDARPLVRHIRSAHEFDRLLQKHAATTGLPVIVDFYSDGCGPCRMMAPVFKKYAKEIGQDKAVFVKVDTNALYQLSSRYNIRSLPTFVFFLHGKIVHQFSGAGEGQLRQYTQQIIRQSELENVVLSREELISYYSQVDPTKKEHDIVTGVYKKCAEMTKPEHNPSRQCVGGAANQLIRRLRKKYGAAPKSEARFTERDRAPASGEEEGDETHKRRGGERKKKRGDDGDGPKSSPSSSSSSSKPNLHLATKEELMAELEKRVDEEIDAAVEEEDDDDAEFEHMWSPGDFPERVTIVGAGPAGMSAAIYAARAGLNPVVVAPPMGGQLQGKGVDVENYPGLANMTGPGVISAMRNQAALFGAAFEADLVTEIDASTRPFKVRTNSSVIATHSIIVATGAESNWLGIPGEYEMRGGGVSSCATCDGAIFRGKDVLVVGGGDTAMEDALVLARTSKSVTVIHRRDTFRASRVLAQRVMEHPSISIRWNSTVKEIMGKVVEPLPSGHESEVENIDLDDDSEIPKKVVTGAILMDVSTREESKIDCDAVFVAIGHTPATAFLQGIVEFDEEHPGYVKTIGRSTRTSVPGIFAAGDVSDSVYRQAITSAGSGAAAALDAERWLSEEGLGNEAAEFEAELLAELMADDEEKTAERAQYNVYEDAGGRMAGMKESVAAEL